MCTPWRTERKQCSPDCARQSCDGRTCMVCLKPNVDTTECGKLVTHVVWKESSHCDSCRERHRRECGRRSNPVVMDMRSSFERTCDGDDESEMGHPLQRPFDRRPCRDSTTQTETQQARRKRKYEAAFPDPVFFAFAEHHGVGALVTCGRLLTEEIWTETGSDTQPRQFADLEQACAYSFDEFNNYTVEIRRDPRDAPRE